MDKKVFTIGYGHSNQFVLTHNLGTSDVILSIRENKFPGEVVGLDITVLDENNVKISTDSPSLQGSYSVTIIG